MIADSTSVRERGRVGNQLNNIKRSAAQITVRDNIRLPTFVINRESRRLGPRARAKHLPPVQRTLETRDATGSVPLQLLFFSQPELARRGSR